MILGRVKTKAKERKFPAALPQDGVVLVVDDNAQARGSIADSLRSLGLVPLVVDSCDEALKAVRRTSGICLVMVDGEMPRPDGMAAIDALFENGLSPEARVIVMEDAFNSKAGEITSESISRRITKPITPTRLYQAICDIFDAHGAGAEGVLPEVQFDMLQGRRVLVVDDNEFNTEVISALLLQVGVEVDVCDSGFAALERLGRGLPVDVVLMDVEMPEMNGYETTKKIRGDLKLKDLPIIALTANAFRETYNKCLESGMSDCVTKPIDTQLLYKKLTEWICK
jgi:CheY-like chemotaxis protein